MMSLQRIYKAISDKSGKMVKYETTHAPTTLTARSILE